MDLKLLGFGGAFEPEIGNSAFWIRNFHGKNLLVDCGFTVYARLKELSLDTSPDAILVTHLHADHVGSLTNEIFWLWFQRNKQRVPIYLPAEHFRQPLWNYLQLQLITPERYVELLPLPEDGRILAIDTYGEHIPDMPTFGYILRDGKQSIVISGDTAKPETIFAAIESHGIEPEFVLHEVSFESNAVAHVHYKELEKWLPRYRIHGYHCNPAKKPADCKIPLAWETPAFHF